MRNIIPTLMTLTTALFAQSDSSYRVTHTYTLGGDGSWDYVVPDPPNHRLFIARQTRVMVVDEDSGKLLGEVEGIRGAHGTAVAESTGHGFATEGNGKSVVMFDLKTFKVLGRIPAAEDADAIIYDSASNRVFTLNGDAHSSTVIDARAGTLITNIPLGGKPEYSVSAGDGKVYANLTDTNEVVEIDGRTAVVSRRWPMRVGGSGLFVSTALFVYMTVELNKTLPPGKKLFPTGRDWREIQRLHEQLFPASVVRTAQFVLGALSTVIIAIGVFLAIKPK
jgi:DNA-binding beta-propeller fold protein YncE